MDKRTIIQYFEWYLPPDCQHWNRVAADAQHLAELGFTDVWLPPAYKAHSGTQDVGYGVYDLYDLGEFDQKGSIPTKYGTKDEYLNAIHTLHHHGLKVMADVVLNHRMGADFLEETTGSKMNKEDRNQMLLNNKKLSVWTRFIFPGRMGKYSDFVWTSAHFSSVDYNGLTGSAQEYVFKLTGHRFSENVTDEKGNYDYLMGSDVDFNVPEVVEELKRWGRWYLDFTGVDSLRLDAVKHISHEFYPGWLDMLRVYKQKPLFAVGEYWRDNIEELQSYLYHCGHRMSLFDVPLHHRFERASLADNSCCLAEILQDTLVEREPFHAVTFVDNHDSQPHQALESWVQSWFKPLAYALILLREGGTPCVFYGDLYGIPHSSIDPVRELPALLKARKDYGFGHQESYFDHHNTIGWTRGDHMAVVMTNGSEGWKEMPLGSPGQVFVDLLGNRQEEVVIGPDGCGRFTCNGRSVSVWVPKK